MKDDDLRQRLNQLPVPEGSAVARERARHRAVIAFQQARSGFEKDEPGRQGFVWNWRYAGVLALLVALASFILVPSHLNHVPENLADDRHILHEMEALFPHQVDSVVEEKGKVDLSIAQSSLLGSDQPVVLIFQREAESIRVLSYSGHRVCVTLGKNHTCFDILATPAGGVILEAGDHVWLASNHSMIAGYNLRAQTLEASL
jgi:hypothetical protein